MRFDWDDAKALSNLAKHGISFELAKRVWDDPLYEVTFGRVVDGEERWLAVGVVGTTTIIVVVHAFPDLEDDQRVRIISARKATSQERRQHER
ncbi:MAG TPA: BrnT family toxin [Caulobacteraceae bacterium]|nr:BrnT family toxin [Caulobacteraceae bacterium]